MKTRAGRELHIKVYKYLGEDNYEKKFHSRNTMTENDLEKRKYYYLHRKPFGKEANIKWTFTIHYQEKEIFVNIFDVEIVKNVYSSKTFSYGLQVNYKLRKAYYTGDFSLEKENGKGETYEAYMLRLANTKYSVIPEETFDTAEEAKQHIINRFI
jgi:hypothetical protein